MKSKMLIRNEWVEFHVSLLGGFHFYLSPYYYFDERPMIHIELFFFSLFLHLPYRSGIANQCEFPRYGLNWHDNALWIYWSKAVKVFHAPWSWQWVRTSYLMKEGEWLIETKGNSVEYGSRQLLLWKKEFPFSYIRKSGEIQDRVVSVSVEEREWRWRWFIWLGFPRMIRRTIWCSFNNEIGEEVRSWKGGTTGCGYRMLGGEQVEHTLERMMKDKGLKL